MTTKVEKFLQTLQEVEEDQKSKKAIKDLIETSWSGSNEDQMRSVAILKGLALSDSSVANKFMKKLDDLTSGLDPKDFE